MRALHLSRGKFALIDDADFERLSVYKWFAIPQGVKWRARARIDGSWMYLHRAVLGPGAHIDHINGDPLDNQRANLRFATRKQNQANRGPNKNSSTGFKGVIKIRGRFQARAQVDRKWHYLGTYDKSENAAKAYDQFARRIWGDFAYVNFTEAV